MGKEVTAIRASEKDYVVGMAFCAAAYRLYANLTKKARNLPYDFDRFRAEFDGSVAAFEDYRQKFDDTNLLELTMKSSDLAGIRGELRRASERDKISVAGREMAHPLYLCAKILRAEGEEKGYCELGKRIKEATDAGKVDIRDLIGFLSNYGQKPAVRSPSN